jgi:S-adenosylmethionine hydrolase
VVDPGVGGRRDAIVVRADGRTFVGPDNGLLSIVWQRARRRNCFRIAWRPERLSSSFHGRDLFAPLAAELARGRVPRGWLAARERPGVLLDARDLSRVIYVDHYGNAVTGLRASRISTKDKIRLGKQAVPYARTFEAARGLFWYSNSMGLVEIAASKGSAARSLRLRVGSPVSLKRVQNRVN